MEKERRKDEARSRDGILSPHPPTQGFAVYRARSPRGPHTYMQGFSAHIHASRSDTCSYLQAKGYSFPCVHSGKTEGTGQLFANVMHRWRFRTELKLSKPNNETKGAAKRRKTNSGRNDSPCLVPPVQKGLCLCPQSILSFLLSC